MRSIIMSFRIRPDAGIREKIKKLIDEGTYTNEQEFFRIAINNQLEDDLNPESKPDILIEDKVKGIISEAEVEINAYPPAMKHWNYSVIDITKLKNFQRLETLDLKEIEPLSSDELYGPTSTGLIFFIQNRFLPIKLIVTELARTISEKKSQWIDLDDFKNNVSELAIGIGERLREIKVIDNDINLSTGFPVSIEKLKERHGNRLLKKIRLKENKNRWLIERSISGKRRFVDQFLGKPIKKDERMTFYGACFEMGLISVVDDNGWKLTLTENGTKFASMKNHVLELISSNIGEKNIDKVFSENELKFILKNIIPKFGLEKNVINEIMKKKKGHVLIAEDAKNILETQKRDYLIAMYEPKDFTKFEIEYKKKMEKDQQKDILIWLTEKQSDVQTAATMRRLAELGVVSLKIKDNKPKYTVIRTI